MSLVAVVVGIVVVITSWAGLLSTFVLPRGRSFFQRLPTRAQRIVYGSFLLASKLRRDYARKDALLAAVGPAALIVQLAMFLSLFLLGYTLILWHWAHQISRGFAQAAAGLFTVGLAHVSGPSNDVVVVLAAASGGIAIALQIGYLPVIYQSFSRRESLVALMESRAGVPAWGPEVLIRHQLISSTEALAKFYEEWELWSADLAESHGTHPVLLLFRSPVAGYSWLLSQLAILDAAALQLALSPKAAPVEARMCLRMGFTALRRLAHVLRWSYDKDPLPDSEIELSFEEFAAAVELLGDAGFPIERSAEEAWPHFRGWRVNYESIAYRLADYLTVPHAPWSGRRRYLASDVELPDRPPHREPDGTTHPASFYRRSGLGARSARREPS